MKFINLPKKFEGAFEILKSRLGTDSIDVTVELSDSGILTASYDGKVGKITCSEIHHFTRLLGVFVHNFKKSGNSPFAKTEKAHFETLSTMLDVSRGSVPTLASLKEFLEYIAPYGAKKERGLGAIRRLNLYLNGYIERLEELECQKYEYPGSGPVNWARGSINSVY